MTAPSRLPAAASRVEPRTLLSEADLATRVHDLGTRIQADHPDGVVLIGVLKGALLFLADLIREIHDIDVLVDFIAISRYAPDSGRVRILHDVSTDLEGRDVIVVEDLVDTGLTLGYLLEHFRARSPRTLEVCALLDRPVRRIVPCHVRYVGAEIDDVFVLGYGLHRADRYRNVGRVVEADRRLVQDDPAAYVATLYGRRDADAGVEAEVDTARAEIGPMGSVLALDADGRARGPEASW
ncbi:MAG: phosphoribosyltransferase family protein [Acidimicrobiia bacterium]